MAPSNRQSSVVATRLLAFTALTLAALATASPAAAQRMVTGPTGTHTVGQPVTITWSGYPGGPTALVSLSLTLTDASSLAGTINIPLAGNVPNSGQHSAVIPAGLCQPNVLDQPTSQWNAYAGVSDGAVGSHRNGPAFKLRCPPRRVTGGGTAVAANLLGGALLADAPQVGHLTVTKTVVNATGGAAPPYPKFAITVTCTSTAGEAPVRVLLSVGANQAVSLAQPVPAGAICQASETPPPPVDNARGCPNGKARWTTTYSAPATIPAGGQAVLKVTNTLNCAS